MHTVILTIASSASWILNGQCQGSIKVGVSGKRADLGVATVSTRMPYDGCHKTAC